MDAEAITLQQEIKVQERQNENIENFIQKAHKYVGIEELDGYTLRKLVSAIYVDAPDKSSGKRVQHIHIKYDRLGFIPLNELMKKGRRDFVPYGNTRFSSFFDFTVLRPLGISERGVFVSERTLRYYAFMYVNHKMLIKSMFFFHRQKSAKALPSFLQGLTNLHRSHFHQLHLPLPLVYSSWILVFWVAASLIPLR